MAPRPSRLLVACASALLAGLIVAAPAQAIQLAPAEPHSPNAEDMNTAYWVMFVVTAVLIVLINAALIAAIVRFRDRRGRRPARVAAGRGALRPVLGGLSLLAIAIFAYGVVTTENVREVESSGPGGLDASQSAQVGVKGAPQAAVLEGEESATGEDPITGAEPTEKAPLEIDAIAQQWVWRFEYPGGQPGQRTFSYGELVVPVDTTVLMNIDSTDVMHSWWVPALGGQVQAAPGKITQTWFKADEEGRYPGRSTIFSGSAYPAMRAWVEVVGVPEYQSYVEQLRGDITEAQGIVAREVASQ
ncbi:MAG TPA: cytochrome c oxidase subunit II [Solirubrobacterales bacterium]|nr:cytochrome c oxidase subunit II [Solirubrobacterales bacterium]